jgi:uncharacterized membrane protein YsdA (DUF1294 family)
MNTAIAVYLSLVLVMSFATFLAYGRDKGQAAAGGRRIPERTLHLMAFFGGWPGAILGQRHFRHKTQKGSFRVVFWIVLVVHIAIVAAVGYALVDFRKREFGLAGNIAVAVAGPASLRRPVPIFILWPVRHELPMERLYRLNDRLQLGASGPA